MRRGFSTLPTKGVLGINAVKEYGKGQNGLYIIRSDLFCLLLLVNNLAVIRDAYEKEEYKADDSIEAQKDS